MKRVFVSDETTVAEIADRMGASGADVIRAGFEELGLLLTIEDRPGFQRLNQLAAHFSFRAVRDEGEAGGEG